MSTICKCLFRFWWTFFYYCISLHLLVVFHLCTIIRWLYGLATGWNAEKRLSTPINSYGKSKAWMTRSWAAAINNS